MRKSLLALLAGLIFVGGLALSSGVASADDQEEFCDTDRVVHNLYRGTTKSMRVTSLFTGCVAQRWHVNADGSRGQFICAFTWGFESFHQNDPISGRISMERAWSDDFPGTHIAQRAESSCPLIGNGHGGEWETEQIWMNARYRNDRRLPFLDQRTTPAYWVFHTAAVGDPIDYSLPGATETIIRVVRQPDWKFGPGTMPAQVTLT